MKLNLPIRWKLTLWYSGILTLILVIFSTSVYFYFKKSLEESIDVKIRSIGDVLTSSLGEMQDINLFGNFERYLENVLGRKPKGKIIQIMDRSGKIGAKMSDLDTESLPTSFSTLERALKGEVVYETISGVSPRIRIVTLPIKEGEKVTSIVQVGTSLEEFDETMRRLFLIILVGIPSLVGLTGIGGFFLARKALKPVDEIRRAALRISSANLDERIEVGDRKDELGKLANTFNEMIARLRDAFKRINQFSADVSHELKTPLTIMKGEAEVALRKERTKEEYQKLLKSHLEEIDRMTKIIEDLLFLSKAETAIASLRKEYVNMRVLLLDICRDLSLLGERKGVKLIVEDIPDVSFFGDELKLRRMFSNIIENGIKYTNTGGMVQIFSEIENGNLLVHIKDTGIGIPKEDLNYIFDRFYRVDRARKRESGTGLGLSISKRIAELHGGTISVKSEIQKGSLFTVKLPLTA